MRATRAEINLGNIKYNLQQVKERVGDKVKVMGVVKANAYGHGITEVANYITKNKLVDYLGVAIVEEGIILREAGITLPILAFTSPFESQAEEYVKYNIEPAISNIGIAQVFSKLGESYNKRIPIHIKVDTGMGRLGVDIRLAASFIKEVHKLENIDLRGVFSHFASSDEQDKTFARIQLNRFKELKTFITQVEEIKSPIFHIANSAAIIDLQDSYLDMVRPGIMMYGYYPSHDTTESIEIKPALSLKSKVSFIKIVDANTSISYNRRYFTEKKTRIVTIPIGYADGYYRSLTNKGYAIIRDKKFRISGTVCMDQVMIDIDNNFDIKEGDDVIFIGEDKNTKITAWDIADLVQTIPYEVCCSISARVPRIYISEEE